MKASTLPNGYFGEFGGRYVPEVLIPALEELEQAHSEALADPAYAKELAHLLATFCGRPTPLTFAQNLTAHCGGAKIYLKNEGLNITGAHKVTHCVGQALLAKRMGKTRLIAETGAGQHGVATATVAAKFGMQCTIFMGRVDMERQRPNVFIMERLGATVVPVDYGSRTLKDAVNAALRDWIQHSTDTYYLLGSALGPHPYPAMVHGFQSVVSKEISQQIRQAASAPPNYVIACVGGGSNAIGAFSEFIDDESVRLIGVEAGGKGNKTGQHAMRFAGGSTGVVEGYKSIFLQDNDGQLQPTHSVSAGLDYPGIGPELAYLHQQGRVRFTSATDKEALAAFDLLAKKEGVLPALESSHAVAEAVRLAPTLPKDTIIVVNLSGRADKDLFILAAAFGDANFYDFLRQEAGNHEQ
jgi:tryptophan synthase beta chain